MRDKTDELIELAMVHIREATGHLLKYPIFEHEWDKHIREIQEIATKAVDQFKMQHPEVAHLIEAVVRREPGTDEIVVRLQTPPSKEQLN